MEKKEIKVRDNYSIAKVTDIYAMSSILKEHIIKNNLYTNIVGKNYVQVEGWQFAGGLMGIFPKVAKVENLSNEKEIKWSAQVEIVNQETGNIISSGFAVCSNAESRKRSFDEYAILSMAQTRAIGKAYRNVIGWVMKLAGYEATPSEEIKKMDGTTVFSKKAEDGDDPFPKNNPERKFKKTICTDCKKEISDAEKVYSEKNYNMILCKECQKKYKKNLIKK